MVPRGQEASVLDLALPPTSHITKKSHITSLRLHSEADIIGCQEPYLSLHILLAGRTPILFS